MGQQQLLLVILVTIIVGIATVVAINTFGSAADQANIDAVNNDIATLASAAQGYYMRPQMLGGGGRSFDGITFEKFSFAGEIGDDPDPAEEGHDPLFGANENGVYEIITNNEDDYFVVRGVPTGAGGSIAARVCQDQINMGDYDPNSEAAADPGACD